MNTHRPAPQSSNPKVTKGASMNIHRLSPLSSLAIAACLIAVITAGSAFGALLPIVNPGFEQVQVSSGDPTPVTITAVTVGGLQSVYYYNGAVASAWVPGWSAVGDSDFSFKAGLQHNPTQFLPGFPAGSNELFVNGIIVGQTLADVLAAKTQYTLTVDVARRNDGTGFGGYTVTLLAGTTVIGSDAAGSGSLLPGDHLTSTVIVDSITLSPTLLGQALRIELTGPVNNQAHFDSVQLDALMIPEPCSVLLLGCGVALFARRHRKTA